jgi:multicomponent Na+:H+ antiporter subunit D
MAEHLPVLLVVTPLIAAPLCVLLRRREAALALTVTVNWAVLAMAVELLRRVLRDGAIRYELGGWSAPWGIEYRVDALSAFVLVLVSFIGAMVISYAPASLAREIPKDRQYLFCTLYLLCVTGLLGIAITGDLFNLFVFLEISSLSSYALISMGLTRRAHRAAFQYLILGTIGATFILIGIGLMYQMTGTLNMADMAERLSGVTALRTVRVAFAFLSVGICLKMALFPLHLWLPDAYTYAPSVVTAFLAATATKVSVYILLRFVYSVYGTIWAFETEAFDSILLPMALGAMFVASTVAIFQKNVKRMLAYSSVAQIGYIVLGISFASVTGLTAGSVHLFNHCLTKAGLFLAMGCIALQLGSVRLEDMRGIGRRMPLTMAAWVVGGLSLIGVPGTVGFISKWYLVSAALERGSWLIAVLVLLSSLLALVYVWRVVEIAYFHKPPEGAPRVTEARPSLLIPVVLLIGATVLFGLWTPLTAGVAQFAAQVLLGSGP